MLLRHSKPGRSAWEIHTFEPMTSIRQNKVARLIQKDLGELFQQEGRSWLKSTHMVTVTVVKISPDLAVARVYVSVFPSKDVEQVLERINQAKSDIRGKLGQRVRHQLRIVPELAFFIDDSLDYAERIDSLLK